MKTRLNNVDSAERSWKLALTLLLAAAAAGVLVLDNLIGVSVLISPLVAALLLVPVYVRCGLWPALGTWAAVSVLALVLVTNPITSALYVAFGYYPILRSVFGKLSTCYERFCAKFGYCNILLAVLAALLFWRMDRQTVGWLLADVGGASIFTIVVLANAYFALYDFAAGQMAKLCTKIPKKLPKGAGKAPSGKKPVQGKGAKSGKKRKKK